jgi:hypothetical protein
VRSPLPLPETGLTIMKYRAGVAVAARYVRSEARSCFDRVIDAFEQRVKLEL